jgi:hypothetical protein
MNLKNKIMLMVPVLLWQHTHAQTPLGEFKPTIKAEIFVGGTVSFSTGKFINEHKVFHDISYSDADISGKVKPILFFDAGAQGRVVAGDEGLLSRFSVSLGLFYSKRGFNHIYSYTSTNSSLDINDKMEYSERYTLHHLSVPILIRYGKKWFVEAGPSIDHFVSASRKQTLTRKISGNDAYEGGFSTTEKDKQHLDKSLFEEHPAGLIIGLGTCLNDNFSIRLTNHLFTKTFTKGDDFKSYNLQLEIIFNLLKNKNNEQ